MNSGEHFRKRLRQAIKASAFEIQDEAQSNHRFISRTGKLERAVDVINPSPLSALIFIDDKAAKYGKWIHEGTREYDIFPKKKKSLRWVAGNEFAFAKRVHHPGIKKDQFLYRAFKAKKDDVRRIFEMYTERAVKDIATGLEQGNNRLFIKLK